MKTPNPKREMWTARFATTTARREIEAQARRDYNDLLGIKTNNPTEWNDYINLIKEEENVADEYAQDHNNENKQRELSQLSAARRNHPLYQLTERLHQNYAQIEYAIAMAMKHGIQCEDFPEDVSLGVYRLTYEGFTGKPLSLEDEARFRKIRAERVPSRSTL